MVTFGHIVTSTSSIYRSSTTSEYLLAFYTLQHLLFVEGMRKVAIYFQSHEENQPSYLEVCFFLLPLVVFLCLISPWLNPCDIRIPHHINTFRGIQLLLYIGIPLCCHHGDLHSEEMLHVLSWWACLVLVRTLHTIFAAFIKLNASSW